MNFTRSAHVHHLGTSAKGVRILVASENPVEAQALETWLRNERFEDIRVTSDVREIAPLYGKWPYSLLILDMHSQLISGLGILQALDQPITSTDLSVLALINPGAEQDRLAAMVAGASATVARPLQRDAVMGHIRHILMPDGFSKSNATAP